MEGTTPDPPAPVSPRQVWGPHDGSYGPRLAFYYLAEARGGPNVGLLPVAGAADPTFVSTAATPLGGAVAAAGT